MRHLAYPHPVTRDDLVAWFHAERERSARIFSIPVEGAYYDRPIKLRNPIVFYEGHLPAFAINTLIKLALGRPGINEDYEVLFARGIDPEDEAAAKSPTDLWPSRESVQAYGARATRIITRALCDAPIDDGLVPQRVDGQAAIAILEHEEMHQETLLYMFHQLPYERKNAVAPFNAIDRGKAAPRPRQRSVRIPEGVATLGASEHFAWDNEMPAFQVRVPEFEIDVHNVTNGEYLEYMNATGAAAPQFWRRIDGDWFWHGMFALTPLDPDAPVYVMYEEAEAFARWKGKRVPTEAEYHRAAFGTPGGEERLYPWGNEAPDATRGNFDFSNWDPVPAGSYPAGASAWGVHDLVGNGWEWTSTVFDGFTGFQQLPSYPVYSSDFFDGQHYVLKGASPVTAKELVRRSFRNWFRPNYPYVYATFRCAS